MLSTNKDYFPYNYYSIRFSTFADRGYTSYKKKLVTTLIDSSSMSTEYATNDFVKRMYAQYTNDNVKERARHKGEYRLSRNKFCFGSLKELNERVPVGKNYTFGLKIGNSMSFENDLMIFEGGIGIDSKGTEKQILVKTDFALEHSKDSVDVLLFEEPENHLSHLNLRKLVQLVSNKEHCQIFITTHNMLMFTKNADFKKCVQNIISPKTIVFPSSNIDDIEGRIEYAETLFKEILKKISTQERMEPKFQLLLMYISKVRKICGKVFENIKSDVSKQRMAGKTLKELHNNFKIVEPLIRSDFKKVFGNAMDKTGYAFCIKSQDSISQKIHMAQEKYFKDKGYTDLQACKASVIDAIRYTILYSIDVYLKNYSIGINKIENEGYKLIRCKNFWRDGGSYNGINALFLTPYGYFVEVQFHTPESKNLNFAMHKLYEELRNPEISDERKAEIEKQMKEMSKQYKNEEELVEKIKDIKDFELSEIVWSLPPE